MPKILVICPHPEDVAPGQRLKYEQYFDYLRAHNYDIVVSPFMTLAFWNIVYKKGNYFSKVFWTIFGYFRRISDLFRVPFYDGIYVFLWVTPFGSTLFERLYVLLAKKIIYDIDDLVFLKPKSKANPIAQLFKSSEKMIYLMKKANHVITCTPYLDEFVRKYNDKTTDISSTINTDTYIPTNKYSNDKPITLGWSGSFSTSKYLKLLKVVLKKIQQKYNARILIIGDASFKIEGLEVEAVAWSQKEEVVMLSSIDIGLYPLPDEEWVYGKSGLKALQYMALGIPTIATAIGANFRVIENEVSGFLVESEEEWEDRICSLIESPELRKSIGLEARKKVEKYYSVNANKETYLKILNKVINK